MEAYRKYRSQAPQPELSDRRWPSQHIEHAPVWCSVDLRDGNQALVDPMNPDEKTRMFSELVHVGFKEIEVGFPSSNDTEFSFIRSLIERELIPDDVTIQVLVQAREHLIEKTFEAIEGAKNVIVHLYNACSEPLRRIVFNKSRDEIIALATEGAALIKKLSAGLLERSPGMKLRYEYSPEFFSGTEPDFILEICEAVMKELGASEEEPVIINLPSSVQFATPNVYADQIEFFCRNISNRKAAIVSVHSHNDRGTGIAEAELALMAGAERVEGTLFGNGERTGNCDIVTLALNMLTQGIDPRLDFSDLNRVKLAYELCTRMHVPDRQPYAGALVFTAFSGSHQDAISKGLKLWNEGKSDYWEVPYLPMDPGDIGRQYEPVIRINSQSGKGGASFVLRQNYGFMLPQGMRPEFGLLVKHAADRQGTELTAEQIMELFSREYINIDSPYVLLSHSIFDTSTAGVQTRFEGILECLGDQHIISGAGNGPIDAFFAALGKARISGYKFVSYHEHAVGEGSDAKAAAYIELRTPDNRNIYGVGVDPNINLASIKGVLCAINRSCR